MRPHCFFTELLEPDNILNLYNYFQKRAADERHVGQSAPGAGSISLYWCLENWREVASSLEQELKQKSFWPALRVKTVIQADRKREIFSQRWLDKIVEQAISSLLFSAFEPFIKPSVHSYRKGHSATLALKAIGSAIKQHRRSGNQSYVYKTDIERYTDNVQYDVFQQELENCFGPQHPYFMKLLYEYLQPRYSTANSSEIHRLTQGIPTGSALTNFAANFYLHGLDTELAKRRGHYCRFGDDLFFMSDSPKEVHLAKEAIDQNIDHKGLRRSQSKSMTFTLQRQTDAAFLYQSYFVHLGYRVSADGGISLPQKKYRKFKDAFFRHLERYSLQLHRRGATCAVERSKHLCTAARHLLSEREIIPYLSEMRTLINDPTFIKQFDTWLATLIISLAHDCPKHSAFQRQSFRSLRDAGLPSINFLQMTSGRTHVD